MKEFIEPQMPLRSSTGSEQAGRADQINADARREKIFNCEVIEGREGVNIFFFMNFMPFMVNSSSIIFKHLF